MNDHELSTVRQSIISEGARFESSPLCSGSGARSGRGCRRRDASVEYAAAASPQSIGAEGLWDDGTEAVPGGLDNLPISFGPTPTTAEAPADRQEEPTEQEPVNPTAGQTATGAAEPTEIGQGGGPGSEVPPTTTTPSVRSTEAGVQLLPAGPQVQQQGQATSGTAPGTPLRTAVQDPSGGTGAESRAAPVLESASIVQRQQGVAASLWWGSVLVIMGGTAVAVFFKMRRRAQRQGPLDIRQFSAPATGQK